MEELSKELKSRIEKIKELRKLFGIDHSKIAEYSSRSRVTIARVLNESDDRYLTETNVAAIEAGIKKILAEYKEQIDIFFAQ